MSNVENVNTGEMPQYRYFSTTRPLEKIWFKLDMPFELRKPTDEEQTLIGWHIFTAVVTEQPLKPDIVNHYDLVDMQVFLIKNRLLKRAETLVVEGLTERKLRSWRMALERCICAGRIATDAQFDSAVQRIQPGV